MTIAFWTILAAIALPWLMAALKKSPLAVSGKYSNKAPRAMQPKLEGLSQRAHWAEQNSFETTGFYCRCTRGSFCRR